LFERSGVALRTGTAHDADFRSRHMGMSVKTPFTSCNPESWFIKILICVHAHD
jgi:hypothetical protein